MLLHAVFETDGPHSVYWNLTESPPTLDCKSETAEWNLFSTKSNILFPTLKQNKKSLVDFSLVSLKLQKVPNVLWGQILPSLFWSELIAI